MAMPAVVAMWAVVVAMTIPAAVAMWVAAKQLHYRSMHVVIAGNCFVATAFIVMMMFNRRATRGIAIAIPSRLNDAVGGR
jgi:hypothetical protein